MVIALISKSCYNLGFFFSNNIMQDLWICCLFTLFLSFSNLFLWFLNPLFLLPISLFLSLHCLFSNFLFSFLFPISSLNLSFPSVSLRLYFCNKHFHILAKVIKLQLRIIFYLFYNSGLLLVLKQFILEEIISSLELNQGFTILLVNHHLLSSDYFLLDH